MRPEGLQNVPACQLSLIFLALKHSLLHSGFVYLDFGAGQTSFLSSRKLWLFIVYPTLSIPYFNMDWNDQARWQVPLPFISITSQVQYVANSALKQSPVYAVCFSPHHAQRITYTNEPQSFFGAMGCSVAMVFSALGAAYGIAKSGIGISATGVMRPDQIIRSATLNLWLYFTSSPSFITLPSS